MALKFNFYTEKNRPTTNAFSGKPRINIRIDGTITLSKSAAEFLKAGPGDPLTLAQDADDKKSWFIVFNSEGCKLRKEYSGRLRISHRKAAVDLLESRDAEKTISGIVANPTEVDGMTMYPIFFLPPKK